MSEPEIIPIATVFLATIICLDALALVIMLLAAQCLRKKYGGLKDEHITDWIDDNPFAVTIIQFAGIATALLIFGYAVKIVAQWIN